MSKAMIVVVAVCVGGVLGSAGCDAGGKMDEIKQMAEVVANAPAAQKEMEKNAEAQAEEMRKQMEAQMKAEMEGKPAPAAPAAALPKSDGPTGVLECDTYLKEYPACLKDKVPEMARKQMREGFKANKKAWKQMAATPEGKQALQPMCKMALDQAKMAMKAYGCEL